MEADRSRLWRVYLVSVPAWFALALLDPDPPGTTDVGLFDALFVQMVFATVGVAVAAGTMWVSAEHGPWSWWAPARAAQRYAAVAFLGLATLFALVAVARLFH